MVALTEYERNKVVQSLIKAAGDTGEYPTDDEIEIAYEKARRAKGMTDEKGEVIARWVGFTDDNVSDTHPWQDPEGDGYVEPPDFTDPTTLFKWCVPKLKHGWNLKGLDGKVLATVGYRDERNKSIGLPWHAEALRDTPGEALRDAILALIESEKEAG